MENHGQHHYRHFAIFGPRRMAREITAGQDSLTAVTGQRPCFFRPTAGLRNPFLEPILARHGLYLASWTRRGYDTRNRDADDVVRRLTNDLAAGDILLLHDGNAARTVAGQPVILVALPRVLEMAAATGLKTVTLRSTLDRPHAMTLSPETLRKRLIDHASAALPGRRKICLPFRPWQARWRPGVRWYVGARAVPGRRPHP